MLEGRPKVATVLYILVGRVKMLAKVSSTSMSSCEIGWDDSGPASGLKLGLGSGEVMSIVYPGSGSSLSGVCGGVSSIVGAGMEVPSVREYWMGRIDRSGAWVLNRCALTYS